MSTEQLRTSLVRRLIMLVDHDNQPIDTRRIVRTAMSSFQIDGATLHVRIRAYGGWFENGFTSVARYEAANHYQESCPAVMEVGPTLVRLSFEFADNLLICTRLGGQVKITHTVGIRNTPGEVVPKSTGTKCTAPDCQLGKLQRWTRKKSACLSATCSFKFSDLFQRREQKQVDVHIASDLLHIASQAESQDAVCIVSDDLDLIPAILQAAIVSPTRPLINIRSNQRAATYQDGLLKELGVAQFSI